MVKPTHTQTTHAHEHMNLKVSRRRLSRFRRSPRLLGDRRASRFSCFSVSPSPSVFDVLRLLRSVKALIWYRSGAFPPPKSGCGASLRLRTASAPPRLGFLGLGEALARSGFPAWMSLG
ncbi:hypothetical protein YC2023_092736 [Brassica napus]